VLSAAAILLAGWLIPIERTESRPLQFVMWVAFMVRTFTFHAGLPIACVALYAAAFKLWKPLLACVPLMTITLGPAALSYLPKSPPPIVGPALTVLSCNLLVGSGSTDAAADYIRAQSPDIIFFQEYTPAAHDVLTRAFKESHPHIVSSLRDDAFGQAIYSKLPLTEVKLYPPPISSARPQHRRIGSPAEPQIRCIVALNGREIVLQNVHDMPPAGLSLLQEQLRYFEWLRDFTGAERRPMILAGDFNSTMSSTPNRQLLRDGFQNTHALAGRGRGSTWVDVTWLRHLPGVRIDHVLISQELTCDLSEVGPSTGSDHRPIMARIGFHSGAR
jgi:vancomycin resistance protein VanJ